MNKRTDTFELPCGYIDENDCIHTQVKVVELDHNTDKAISSGQLDAVGLVASHVIEIGDVKDRMEIDDIVAEMEKGDFEYILLRLRCLSLGTEYEYPMICPQKQCKNQSNYRVDLEDQEVVEAPDPRVRTYTHTLDTGEEMVFRTTKASDMDILSEMFDAGNDQLTRYLGLHLVNVDGTTPEDNLKKKGRKCKTKKQHIAEAVRMIDSLEVVHRVKEEIRVGLRSIKGYPDLKTRGTCPKCGTSFVHVIPINFSFIVPSLETAVQRGTL
jgi:hypothetical protein